MVGDWPQGRTLLVTMAVIFVTALLVIYLAEAQGNPR
jgi:K+-transporting ATPase A subunit